MSSRLVTVPMRVPYLLESTIPAGTRIYLGEDGEPSWAGADGVIKPLSEHMKEADAAWRKEKYKGAYPNDAT